MDEVKRIIDQLRKSFEGEAWHGPAVLELLADVDEKRASARPVENAHSIWEIVKHISAWEASAINGIDGIPIDLTDDEDWPQVEDFSASSWQETIAHLEHTHKRVLARLESVNDQDLLRGVPNRNYSLYFLLHGIVQHNLYHAGQIAILKKAG